MAGLALATIGALVAGCGVPVDRSPSALPHKDIPFGLLQPSPRTTTSTSAPSPVEAPVSIFLVASSGHLVAVTREVPTNQDSLATVLDALVQGPTASEAQAGLESIVPAQTTVLGAVVGSTGIATINLGGTFGQLVGQPQSEAAAQIVFTATALPGVSGVTFELSGHAVGVPVASGALVTVATRAQFAPIAPL